jgi:hypothetical protein
VILKGVKPVCLFIKMLYALVAAFRALSHGSPDTLISIFVLLIMVRMDCSAKPSVCGCWTLAVYGVMLFVYSVLVYRFEVNYVPWLLVIDFVCIRLSPIAEFNVLRIVSAVRVIL